MGTDIEPDDGEKYGKPTAYDPTFNGPIKNRSCTDIICLLLFFLFVVAWIALGAWAFIQGRPQTLLYPKDSHGRFCGNPSDEVTKDKPYLHFFDLTACARARVAIGASLSFGCPTPQVCVAKCPNTTWTFLKAVTNSDARRQMLCQEGVDPMDTKVSVKDLVKDEQCAAYYFPSSPVLKRCIPSILVNFAKKAAKVVTDKQSGKELVTKDNETITEGTIKEGTKALGKLLSVVSFGQKALSDLRDSWWQILVLGLVAVCLSLIFIVVMRWVAGFVVWFTLCAFLGIFAFLTYYTFSKYVKIKNSSQDTSSQFVLTADFKYYLEHQTTWLVFGIISAVVLGICLLVLIFLRQRILIAIALIKEGSRAVGCMLFTLIWPLCPFVLIVLVTAYWLGVTLYVQSVNRASVFRNVTDTTGGKILVETVDDVLPFCNKQNRTKTVEKACQFLKFGNPEYTVALQLFSIFMYFWVMNFVIAFCQMTLAGAFASYYWAFNKPADIPTFPLLSSVCRTLRYHLGSLAFGALIIAIVQLIRVILEIIDNKLKKSDNGCARFVIKCCKCCMWCLEKILKFINKNAYILIAIYGKNFCVSAKNAFFLIMRNVVRVFVVDKVTDFLLFLGKLVVVGCVTALAFFFFQGKVWAHVLRDYRPELNFFVIPVIVVAVISYFVADTFFDVYEMAVDTLFLCFLEDIERHDGSAEKPYFMNRELMQILGKRNKKPKADR